MKKNDYILIQAQMISDLHLKGNELLVFALIHGYTKGGSNTCRASLNYIANWVQTGKSAVIKAINNLEEAGYVNRHEYLEGRVKCVEYTTNYEALLLRSAQGEYISLETVKNASKMQRGVKMTPQQSAFHEGCQNDTGVKMTTKGCQNDNGRGVKIAPNNIIDNIIYYYSSRTREEQEQEKKEFFKIFFFRNAADPAAEVERFIAYNETRGWKTTQGVEYDTPEKRRSLAVFWEFREPQKKRCSEEFLRTVENIYNEAGERGVEGRDILLDPRMTFGYDKTLDKMVMTASAADVWKWIEANLDIARFHIMPLLNGKGLTYRLAK